MMNPVDLVEPTRPIPNPRPDRDGNLKGKVTLSPKACKTRARLAVQPEKTIPVIVIPGIMGSNLCATTDPKKKRNLVLKRGEAAWRPPNGMIDGNKEAKKWKYRDPAERQKILDPSTLDVDPSGKIGIGLNPCDFVLDEQQARDQGWGQIHWDSYGELLSKLQYRLNSTFGELSGVRFLDQHWFKANKCDRKEWGALSKGIMAPMTEDELETLADYNFPVYAFGYNWLESNEKSAELLKKYIERIMAYWSFPKRACKPVILVTHSMGGLVARACAKQIPEKIAGIIHGVMPAMGAPLCYRRIACGTEISSPSNSIVGNIKAEKFAEIAGRTAETTTPVMATSAGVLELLPNHLYPGPPGPWLFASIEREYGKPLEVLRLPEGNPYDLYRDTKSWYRMIDPALADPAKKYINAPGGVEKAITEAINQAEKFHTKTLDTYYHPNSYAFYGSDSGQLSFGACRWQAAPAKGPDGHMSVNVLLRGKLVSHASDGARTVGIEGGRTLIFKHSSKTPSATAPCQSSPAQGHRARLNRFFARAAMTTKAATAAKRCCS